MFKDDDDEFARYLASYLKENSEGFINWERQRVFEDVLYYLIRAFRQELP